MTTNDLTQAKLLDEAITSMESAAQIAAVNTEKLGADSDLLELSQALLSADFSADSQLRNSLRDQLLSTTGPHNVNQPFSKPIQQASGTPQRNRYAGRLVTIATIAALIVFAFLAVPQLRSWAQDVINDFFNRTASDTMGSEVSRYTPSTITPTPSYQIFDNVVAAEIATGHDIVTPRLELAAYWSGQVRYMPDSGVVMMEYSSPPRRQLFITMCPLDNTWCQYDEVGASADIIPLEINGVRGIFEGEFVAGGWSIPSEEFERVHNNPAYNEGETISTTLEWTNEMNVRRLRWQQGDWVYEITAWGGDGSFPGRDLMMEDLVALAESMR